MGSVYLARDLSLNRNAALKVLHGDLADNPETVRQFHLEAQAAAPLRHPNIVRIYSAGIQAGLPYIAMEYVEGEPLDRFLRRQGNMPWQTALYIGQQVAEALNCAHRHGVIHRDVKPANILLDSHGQVRLTDFGIANVASVDRAAPQAEDFAGTPHYMSPEQCAGLDAGPTSDIYSLGVTLYYLIAGRLPFDNESQVALIKSITNDEPVRLNKIIPDIPDDVSRLVAHLMSKRPNERPPNAQFVVMTIKRIQEERGGRSAMPEALQVYMREQTRIRQIRSLLKEHDLTEKPIGSFKRPPLPLRAVLARIVSAAAILLVFALIPVIVASLSGKHQPPREPQVIDIANMRDLSEKMCIVEIATTGFICENIRWIGGSQTALAQFVGIKGTSNHDASGILAINLDTRQVTNILTPASPTIDSNFWDVRAPLFAAPASPISAPSQLLDESLLMPTYGDTPRRGERFLQIAAHPWNETRETVLYAIPLAVWNPHFGSPWAAQSNGYAIPKPDGHTFCMVLNDPVQNSNYLVERDVYAEDPAALGSPITSGEAPIVPSSVCYSPSGSQLAYIRIGRIENERQLWVLSLTRNEKDGNPLIGYGVLGNHVAFSPDGSLLAARVARQTQLPELQLVSATNGNVAAHLNTGEFGVQPWHTSNTFVVATDAGQIWAIGLERPPLERQHRRIALSPENLKVSGGAAISSDGRWVAAILEGTSIPSILFIRLDRVTFDDLAASHETILPAEPAPQT